jgi:hypothetical protein
MIMGKIIAKTCGICKQKFKGTEKQLASQLKTHNGSKKHKENKKKSRK